MEWLKKKDRHTSRIWVPILNKRHWMRKPQYQFLWDWNPQLINVGITGPVRIEWSDAPRLDQIVVQCRLNEDLDKAFLTVKPFIESSEAEGGYKIRISIDDSAGKKVAGIDLKKGISPYPVYLEIENPKLWWPAGHGSQPLYNIDIELLSGEVVVDRKSLRTGIRSIKIDQSAHPV